ncbi:MAG: hypothetical protein CL912_15115 [Deltaproteobacteria bacterium]|nr:hypothetical protein [Deltaproteobacteria bacterium]
MPSINCMPVLDNWNSQLDRDWGWICSVGLKKDFSRGQILTLGLACPRQPLAGDVQWRRER